jgi:hypothetical protein
VLAGGDASTPGAANEFAGFGRPQGANERDEFRRALMLDLRRRDQLAGAEEKRFMNLFRSYPS